MKRCRFLEEAGCASLCVNSCQLPTQDFMRHNMGLPLTMTPDYATGECQLAYGKLPTEEEERRARETPCLARCPTAGSMRSWHDGRAGTSGTGRNELWREELEALARQRREERDPSGDRRVPIILREEEAFAASSGRDHLLVESTCHLMED